MRAVLSTRSTVSAIGRGRRGVAITGGARDAKMGCGVVRIRGLSGGEVGVRGVEVVVFCGWGVGGDSVVGTLVSLL